MRWLIADSGCGLASAQTPSWAGVYPSAGYRFCRVVGGRFCGLWCFPRKRFRGST